MQEYTLLSVRSVTNLFSPPYYVSDILEQMDIIGVGSLPIVLLTGFFIGAVMVLQTAAQFERFGQTALTADVVSLALVRELGPSITGLLVAGRNSSGIASELGSMLVTEQVDAMRAMGTDPIRKLVTPRVIATVLMLPLLTAMADFMGFIGGYLVSSFTLRLGAVTFWTRAIDVLVFSDLMQGLTKPCFRFYPVDGRLLSGVECERRNARGRTRDDAGGGDLLSVHPDYQFLPDEIDVVSRRLMCFRSVEQSAAAHRPFPSIICGVRCAAESEW